MSLVIPALARASPTSIEHKLLFDALNMRRRQAAEEEVTLEAAEKEATATQAAEEEVTALDAAGEEATATQVAEKEVTCRAVASCSDTINGSVWANKCLAVPTVGL